MKTPVTPGEILLEDYLRPTGIWSPRRPICAALRFAERAGPGPGGQPSQHQRNRARAPRHHARDVTQAGQIFQTKPAVLVQYPNSLRFPPHHETSQPDHRQSQRRLHQVGGVRGINLNAALSPSSCLFGRRGDLSPSAVADSGSHHSTFNHGFRLNRPAPR